MDDDVVVEEVGVAAHAATGVEGVAEEAADVEVVVEMARGLKEKRKGDRRVHIPVRRDL